MAHPARRPQRRDFPSRGPRPADQSRQIAQLEARYRVNGLSQWERVDLDRRFDRLETQIRARRNDRDGRGYGQDRGYTATRPRPVNSAPGFRSGAFSSQSRRRLSATVTARPRSAPDRLPSHRPRRRRAGIGLMEAG